MSFRTLLVQVLSLGFGLVFPAYESVAALESNTGEDDTHWLIYWLIFSIVTLFESLAWPVLQWIPLYNEIKVAVLAWLVLPQTKGALWVYESLLSPALSVARRELSKFPALEKAITSVNRSAPVTARTDAQNSSEVSQRQSRLGATVGDVQATFEASLKNISAISDPKARVSAEKAFDKDLSRLSKIQAGRQSVMANKAL